MPGNFAIDDCLYTNSFCFMRRALRLLLVGIIFFSNAYGQQDSLYSKKMVRVYEDNDLLNIIGTPGDKGYTNGTRLDFFYRKKHASRFFVDRWLPKAGDGAVNTFSWSLMQVMFTPQDIAAVHPDVKDWPYAGALYMTHALHSANPVKKFSFQSEVVAGVMGPAALTAPFQRFIHRNIGSARPEGWNYQNPTDVLLNFNFTAEKMFWHFKQWLDVTGGAQGMAGTMLDGASVYTQVRIGLMSPYFNCLISQYVKPFAALRPLQVYLVARPALDWIGYNAILDGGVFAGKSDYYKQNEGGDPERINHAITRRMDVGIVFSYGNISCSFTQTILPRLVKDFSHQTVGNLSLNIGW